MSMTDKQHKAISDGIIALLKEQGCPGEFFLLFPEERAGTGVDEDGMEVWKTGCLTSIQPDVVPSVLETVLAQMRDGGRVVPVIPIEPDATVN